MRWNRPWETSLVVRLILSFLFVSLLVTVLLGYITYLQATDMLTQSVFENLEETASLKTAGLMGWVSDQIQNVVLMAWYPVVREQTGVLADSSVDSTKRDKARSILFVYFNLALNQTAYAEEFFIADTTGRVIFSTEPDREGADLSSESFFKEGLSRTYIHPVVREQEERPMMTIVTPVFDTKGVRAGVLISKVSLSRINRIILEQGGSFLTGETYLIDRKSEVITPTFAMKKAGISGTIISPGIENAISGEEGRSLYLNYEGIPVIGVSGWIEELDLGFVSEITQSEAFEPAKRLAFTIIYSGVVLSFILLMGIFFVAHQIAIPVLELTKTARKVSDGDLTVSAPVMTQDEVGQLASSFNQMTAQLKSMMDGLEELVTERTRDLKIAKEEAERANESKSLFLANMTHEIKTPLNAIIGFSLLLSETVKDPRSKQYIMSIRSAGETLLQLITDILDLSRIEAGKLALSPEPTDLAGLIEDIILILEYRAREKSIRIRTTMPEFIPILIIDMARTRQILLNLVENAIKFTYEGEVHLTLSILPDDSDHCDILIEVKDTGIGIPYEDQRRIFRAFEQESPDISREFGGTGLGLAITQTLVTRMNGKITVTSEPGKGSTFTVFFPMVRISHGEMVNQIKRPDHRVFRIFSRGRTRSPVSDQVIRKAGEAFLPRLKELNSIFTEDKARALADEMKESAMSENIPELLILSTFFTEAVSVYDLKKIDEITRHMERMIADIDVKDENLDDH